jgi:hypothetical protein
MAARRAIEARLVALVPFTSEPGRFAARTNRALQTIAACPSVAITMTSDAPLSQALPGSWFLESRIDITATGERTPEPTLGEDPVALLIYDRAGHFAAQFMKRDRSSGVADASAVVIGKNNSRAQGATTPTSAPTKSTTGRAR